MVSRQNVEHRTFAGAVRPQQPQSLSSCQTKRNILQSVESALAGVLEHFADLGSLDRQIASVLERELLFSQDGVLVGDVVLPDFGGLAKLHFSVGDCSVLLPIEEDRKCEEHCNRYWEGDDACSVLQIAEVLCRLRLIFCGFVEDVVGDQDPEHWERRYHVERSGQDEVSLFVEPVLFDLPSFQNVDKTGA